MGSTLAIFILRGTSAFLSEQLMTSASGAAIKLIIGIVRCGSTSSKPALCVGLRVLLMASISSAVVGRRAKEFTDAGGIYSRKFVFEVGILAESDFAKLVK